MRREKSGLLDSNCFLATSRPLSSASTAFISPGLTVQRSFTSTTKLQVINGFQGLTPELDTGQIAHLRAKRCQACIVYYTYILPSSWHLAAFNCKGCTEVQGDPEVAVYTNVVD